MRVIVLSGISGSGKSTWAKGIILPHGSTVVVSADDYFDGPDGYLFNPAKLGDAHAHCFGMFIAALEAKVDLVIVDNTNTTSEEIAPYMLGASAYGYEAEIITMSVALKIGKVYLDEFASRNIHGVSSNVVWNQLVRLQARKLLPWWKHTTVTVKV